MNAMCIYPTEKKDADDELFTDKELLRGNVTSNYTSVFDKKTILSTIASPITGIFNIFSSSNNNHNSHVTDANINSESSMGDSSLFTPPSVDEIISNSDSSVSFVPTSINTSEHCISNFQNTSSFAIRTSHSNIEDEMKEISSSLSSSLTIKTDMKNCKSISSRQSITENKSLVSTVATEFPNDCNEADYTMDSELKHGVMPTKR